MDNKSSDENTRSGESVKRLKTGAENMDFISDLPDKILVYILSFLPLKDSINTLLLRRFGNLWRSITVLDIDYCLYHDCGDVGFDINEHNRKFTNIIRHVLNLRDSGILDKLVLDFYFSLSETDDDDPLVDNHLKKCTTEQIERLISYAISKNVKILDLSLKGCFPFLYPDERYGLSNVFASRHLTNLYLTACDIRSCVTIDLKLLKVLFLHQVSVSDDTMENILIGCPFLENLSVDNCYGLNILDCQNPNLKKVKVSTRKDVLFVTCPYVSSFKIDGCIENIYVLDVSSVVDASINFSHLFRCEKSPYDNVGRLLKSVYKSETLNLCTSSILVLSIRSLMNVPCPLFFCKNLIFEFDLTKWHFPGLALLLRNSPFIETLTINVSLLLNESFFSTEEANWIQSHDFDGDSYWDSQYATLPYLETILIYRYRNEHPCMIKLVEFLLKSAPILLKLVITTTKTFKRNRKCERSQELQELSQKLLRLPRASSQAIIRVS